jgi:hypothetical protein
MKTCPICGRDDLKHQGALNMHKYHCQMKNASTVSRETLEQCEHEFRFLAVSSPIEKKAYDKGFMEVCGKCQMLR